MTTTDTDTPLIEDMTALRKAVLVERFGPTGPRPVMALAADRAGVYELRRHLGARALGGGCDPGICSANQLYYEIARFAGAKGYRPLRWVAEIGTFGQFVDALTDQHPMERSLHLRIVEGLGALIGDGDMTGEGTPGPGSVEAWLEITGYRAWFVDERVWDSGLLARALINFARRSGVRLHRFRLGQEA